MKKILIPVVAWCAVCVAQAAVRLPRFFAAGMVLQREVPVPVWGWADADSRIVVSLYADGGSRPVGRAEGRAGADGTWRVELPSLQAGGPYTLTVDEGGDAPAPDACEVRLPDVLAGDVQLRPGQTNMELMVSRCMDLYREEAMSYTNDRIRYLKLPHQYNYIRPQDDVQVKPWVAVNPSTAPDIGAVCYFFARRMQQETGVPVGIINSSVGGTRVECWMGRANLSRFDAYKHEFDDLKYHQENWPDSVARAEQRAAGAWERKMAAGDTVASRWREPGYDFSSWPVVDVFRRDTWPAADGRPTPGSYWFRQTVELPAAMSGKEGIIRVGALKDADSVFVNGRFVGYTSYEYPPRIYKLPAGLLREGENEVMVHLMAQGGAPAFTQGKLYQIEAGGEVARLTGRWQYAQGCAMPRKPGSTYFVGTPTGLYNAMIAPLRDFAIRGAVWYQGESNVGQDKTYAAYLQAMAGEWRAQFGHDFPFVVVQLAGFQQRHDRPVESGQAALREAQRQAAAALPNAALATAVDLGEWNDIHPQRKKELGDRIALQMLRLSYGQTDRVTEGPAVRSARLQDGRVVVDFDPQTGALKPSADLKSIALAGADGKYVWGKAHTDGDHRIVVDVPQGMRPVSLRYAWDDFPECTIYNTDGLPSPSFMVPVD